MDIPEHDVIVVGAGNAATCAALSAKENGASGLMLEISPELPSAKIVAAAVASCA